MAEVLKTRCEVAAGVQRLGALTKQSPAADPVEMLARTLCASAPDIVCSQHAHCAAAAAAAAAAAPRLNHRDMEEHPTTEAPRKESASGCVSCMQQRSAFQMSEFHAQGIMHAARQLQGVLGTERMHAMHAEQLPHAEARCGVQNVLIDEETHAKPFLATLEPPVDHSGKMVWKVGPRSPSAYRVMWLLVRICMHASTALMCCV